MIVSYIKYLLEAVDEYRIHSPFVYEFYMRGSSVGDGEALRELGVARMEEVPVGRLLGCYLKERDERVCYCVRGIHRSREKEASWNVICGHAEVVLTMDFYDYGYVFYREGMEKQHFVLKRREFRNQKLK